MESNWRRPILRPTDPPAQWNHPVIKNTDPPAQWKEYDMPVGPGGERLPYHGDPGAPPNAPPAPQQQAAPQGGDLVKAFAELGGDVNQPEQTPEVVQQLAEQLGVPPEQVLQMIIEEREEMAGMDDSAYEMERTASMEGARQKLSNQMGGPVGTTPPQMGGGAAPQGMTGGAGQYRPRRL